MRGTSTDELLGRLRRLSKLTPIGINRNFQNRNSQIGSNAGCYEQIGDVHGQAREFRCVTSKRAKQENMLERFGDCLLPGMDADEFEFPLEIGEADLVARQPHSTP